MVSTPVYNHPPQRPSTSTLFPNSNSFQKVPWKIPPRFRQGSTIFTQVPARLRKFRGVSGLLGQIRSGLPKGSVEGSTKVAPRFHQGCASFVISGLLGQIRFGVPPSSSTLSAFFPNCASLGSSVIVKSSRWGEMTRLSLGVLCSKWLSPPRRFFGVLPKQFFTLVSQSPAVFWANGCCFRKGFVEGSAKYSLHLSPKWLLLHKKFFGGFCQLCFTFTYLPVSSWGILGSKLRELLTCLTNTNPVRRKTTHHVVAFGYSLGLFQ